ncbi:FkbM family methyltransferase [Lusitaniella coriacea LEGE 07157]|uniref:FkbM family methyltransferase n=1 Tax=Lusitaniella coriacea LEGE 07157 TaxID=945747 RepID=A0A8J7JDG8_9CYAN|nr:FkbM family methyltransferase [Lusitaniella coriacea]MBE9118270.1 FkbM family methyltransferase [Lusitaniella coriacea LEGE 07157]
MLIRQNLKESANFALARYPRVYSRILQLRKNPNLEKILFLNLLNNTDTVVEVGANRGYYTLLFSHIVGAKGQVHAFEPVPPTFNRLSQVFAQNQIFKNTNLNNLAVGDTNGTITLYMPDDDDGQSSMAVHNQGSWKEQKNIVPYECEIVTLDRYAESHLTQKIDFIKCDIEGAELLFLKGAAKTISKDCPIVYLEVCHDWTKDFGYSPPEIIQFLRPLGYSCFYLLDRQLRLLENPELELSVTHLLESANLLCIPNRANRKITI